MAKYLNLQIPSSCSENWENMTAGHGERFCASCQKSVVDFTRMSDAELRLYFQSYSGSTCGRFTRDQLNRDIPIPPKPIPWIKYFFRISLPAFLLSLKAGAQVQRERVPIEVTPVRPITAIQDTVLPANIITGMVHDEAGLPLPGASGVIKGTKIGTATNEYGQFSIKQPDLPVTLLVSFIGYETREVTITSNNQRIELVSLNQTLMGDVIIVGYIKPKKTKKHELKETKIADTVASIQAYPNPVRSGLPINVTCRNMEKGEYQAALYSFSGQLVQSCASNLSKDGKMQVTPEPITPGTYILMLTHNKTNKQISTQVVIQ